MKGGDLSNEQAPAVGLRFERIIKTDEGRLNRNAKGYLLSIARGVDVNIYLITTEDPRKAMAFCVKWGIPYTKVIHAETFYEIPDIVREMNLVTYYDLDREIVQNVNSRGLGQVKAEQWTLGEKLG